MKLMIPVMLAAAMLTVHPDMVWGTETSGVINAGDVQSVPGSWQQVTDASGTYWTYQDSQGQLLRDCKRQIDGRLYFFDESGRMLSGWITEDGEALDDSSGEAYVDGVYYCGSPDEGWAITGWKYLLVQREDGGMQRRWFYFKSSGRKAADTSITERDENGQYRYTFDENGILRSSKKIGGGTAPRSPQWIERVPSASQDAFSNENGIKRWYYGLSDGEVITNRLKTIDGKEYLFDAKGIMRTGLIAVTGDKKYGKTLICALDDMDADVEALDQYLDEYDLMYFDEATGARQTGTVEITSYGDTHTFGFGSNGVALHGPKSGRLYRAGLLLRADTGDKYQVKTVDDQDYLVNTSGRIQSPGHYNDNGTVWTVERADDGGYEISREQKE